MEIKRFVEIREVLGTAWCQRAVKTGLLLIDLHWMTKEEYEEYWKINSYITYSQQDEKGKLRLLAEIDSIIDSDIRRRMEENKRLLNEVEGYSDEK